MTIELELNQFSSSHTVFLVVCTEKKNIKNYGRISQLSNKFTPKNRMADWNDDKSRMFLTKMALNPRAPVACSIAEVAMWTSAS